MLWFTIDRAIPTFVEINGRKDHLSPAIEHPEIGVVLDPHRERLEYVIDSVTIGREGRRHIDLRTIIHLQCYCSFTLTARACGSCNGIRYIARHSGHRIRNVWV